MGPCPRNQHSPKPCTNTHTIEARNKAPPGTAPRSLGLARGGEVAKPWHLGVAYKACSTGGLHVRLYRERERESHRAREPESQRESARAREPEREGEERERERWKDSMPVKDCTTVCIYACIVCMHVCVHTRLSACLPACSLLSVTVSLVSVHDPDLQPDLNNGV